MVKMLWDSSKVRSIDLQDVFHANGKRFLCGLCSGIDQSGCWVINQPSFFKLAWHGGGGGQSQLPPS